MEIINYSNDNDLRLLGGMQQKTVGKHYRLNKFCLKIETEDGTLIRNYLTGALVLLRPMELINFNIDTQCDYIDFLIGNWFLVPDNYDEEAILKIAKERKAIPITDTYLDHPSHFTILTTTTCNARCFYCYELKVKGKSAMTLEMAEKVSKYIIQSAPKDRQVILDWFGGEPLFNMDVIDLISSRVRAAGFNIMGSIVSNGYLFDDKVIQKAKDIWNLQNVQITLDGTEEIYNKTKNYIYKDTNPFKKVIENIHKLVENNISVSIRMNCDKHNFDDLSKLIDFLAEEFKDPFVISPYVWPVFEEGFERTEEERDKLYQVITSLENKLEEKGFRVSHSNLGEIKGIHCMIDNNEAVCVFPKGELGICEHYLESKFIGHIDNPNEKNWDVIKGWRKYMEPIELCKDCPIKPGCLKVIGCPDEITCFKAKQEYLISHDKKGILSLYEDYKNRPKNDDNCQNGCCQTRPDCPEHEPDCIKHYPTQQGEWQRVMSDGTVIPIKSYQ